MKPGDISPDGFVYAGLNPLSGRPLFTTSADWDTEEPWEQALKICFHIAYGGYKDWRLPSQDELQVLYENRIAIGGFKMEIDAFYWCGAPNYLRTVYWAQNFSNGQCIMRKPALQLLFRPVRGREV